MGYEPQPRRGGHRLSSRSARLARSSVERNVDYSTSCSHDSLRSSSAFRVVLALSLAAFPTSPCRPHSHPPPQSSRSASSSGAIPPRASRPQAVRRGSCRASYIHRPADPNWTAGWDQAWKASATPWDAGDVQPAFRELLDERWEEVGVPIDSLRDGKALVAGCGRVRLPVSLPSRLR